MADNKIHSGRLNTPGFMCFFDVVEHDNGARELRITQDLGDHGKPKRSTIVIYDDFADDFLERLTEALDKLG